MMPKGVSIPRPPAKGRPFGAVWHATQSPAVVRYRPRSTSAFEFSAPRAPNRGRRPASAKIVNRMTVRMVRSSGVHERARILEVLVLDRVRGPVGQGADRAGRVVAGILWKGAGTHDEYVRDVPALQIAVD